MTARFPSQLLAELAQPFWAAWQGGELMTDASAVAGTDRTNRRCAGLLDSSVPDLCPLRR